MARLSKIYTRTGDGGDTGLARGERVPKDHPRIEAIGVIDELNSHIGVLLSETLEQTLQDILVDVQHRLFDLGGELSLPHAALIQKEHITSIEEHLDALNASLPPLKEFILPGGGRASALGHVARATCRRAERRLVTLAGCDTVRPEITIYLNRLSDLLFVICRTLMQADQRAEIPWQNDHSAPRS